MESLDFDVGKTLDEIEHQFFIKTIENLLDGKPLSLVSEENMTKLGEITASLKDTPQDRRKFLEIIGITNSNN